MNLLLLDGMKHTQHSLSYEMEGWCYLDVGLSSETAQAVKAETASVAGLPSPIMPDWSVSLRGSDILKSSGHFHCGLVTTRDSLSQPLDHLSNQNY